jgi:hypothetical protein
MSLKWRPASRCDLVNVVHALDSHFHSRRSRLGVDHHGCGGFLRAGGRSGCLFQLQMPSLLLGSWRGKPMLSAEQIEDVVASLAALRS